MQVIIILNAIPWNSLRGQQIHSATIGYIGTILLVIHNDRNPRFGFRSLLDKSGIDFSALELLNNKSAKVVRSEHSTKRGMDTQRSTIRGHNSRGASQGKVHFLSRYFRSDAGKSLNIIKNKIDIQLS